MVAPSSEQHSTGKWQEWVESCHQNVAAQGRGANCLERIKFRLVAELSLTFFSASAAARDLSLRSREASSPMSRAQECRGH